MKKALSLLNIIAVLGFCAMFSSCHEEKDIEVAMTISGQWTGDWNMYYEYTWVENGIEYVTSYDSYDTDIIFYPDYEYATHGYGYQVDWYREGPYQRLSYRFYWEVTPSGSIYLEYPGYDYYNSTILSYRLNNNHFIGRFEDSASQFDLIKIQDYYNWYDYERLYNTYGYTYLEWDWGGGYYYDYDYYYAKTRNANVKADTEGKPSEGHITKIGRREKVEKK